MELTSGATWTAASRPGWKTWLVCILLGVIPVVGWSMATMYWVTRREPWRYDAGDAAVAGLVLLVPWLLLILLLIF